MCGVNSNDIDGNGHHILQAKWEVERERDRERERERERERG